MILFLGCKYTHFETIGIKIVIFLNNFQK